MTDFYTACHERENEIIQETREQLEDYQIEVKHRDGVYRHIVCYDPERGGDCSFHVYTAPWTVTILGDWCSAYTLKRVPDMLTEFLNRSKPNVRYWAEKVQNRTRLRTVEYKFVKLCLFDYLDEWAGEDIDAETLDECKRELAQWIDIDDPDFVRQLSDWCFGYRDKDSGDIIETTPFSSFTYEDAAWDVWTDEWIRVCELLRWAACKVAAMEVTK
ncbi:hypothetical protein [Mobiluncus curtisii]|uniref:hypothetical protein n=1 Tax=Mobiluncus curtisii TaxID=2051 RepID=UPI0014705F32|nr:hypothetical protein [Mobiluncus curtisii]NMW48925.1 hypothetical protein [Mobiluncus curtisii]NMW89040.1 hypothetical protein [Mobiluncus curtisii]